MKKLVLALAIVALVAAAGFAGTRAFFSDTETSQANVFAAGSMDLLVGINNRGTLGPDLLNPRNLESNQALFNFEGLVPGDHGSWSYALEVDQEAYACLATDITSADNNLDDYLEFGFFEDDGDGIYEPGERGLNVGADGWAASDLEAFGYAGIAHDQDNPENSFLSTTTIAANDTRYLGVAYCFGDISEDASGLACDGSGDHNDAQGESVVGTVYFYAEQAANNPNFTCSSLNGEDETGSEEGNVVTQENLQGWTIYPTDTTKQAQYEFVADSSAPLGDGALELSGTDTTKYVQFDRNATTPTPAENIDVSYDTKRIEGALHAAPSYVLGIDQDGNPTTTNDVFYAWYEPVYNDTIDTNYDEWNTWNITADSTFWYNGDVPTDVVPRTDYRSLNDVLADLPNATVIEYTINQGTGNTGWVTLVDNVVTPESVYDFEN